MNEKVEQALGDAINMAKATGDNESAALLLMVCSVMILNGSREAHELLRPLAERLLGMEQSWPAEVDAA